jgi:hypothetical protein
VPHDLLRQDRELTSNLAPPVVAYKSHCIRSR